MKKLSKVEEVKGYIKGELEVANVCQKATLVENVMEQRHANNRRKFTYQQFLEGYEELLESEDIIEEDMNGFVYIFVNNLPDEDMMSANDIVEMVIREKVDIGSTLEDKIGSERLASIVDCITKAVEVLYQDVYTLYNRKKVNAIIAEELGGNAEFMEEAICWLMNGVVGQQLLGRYDELCCGETYCGLSYEDAKDIQFQQITAESDNFTPNDWAKLVKREIEAYGKAGKDINGSEIVAGLVNLGYNEEKVIGGAKLLYDAGYVYEPPMTQVSEAFGTISSVKPLSETLEEPVVETKVEVGLEEVEELNLGEVPAEVLHETDEDAVRLMIQQVTEELKIADFKMEHGLDSANYVKYVEVLTRTKMELLNLLSNMMEE